MRPPILGVDVDSTVWDLTSWVCEATLEVVGERLDPRSLSTWTHILNAYGEEVATEVYTHALSPRRVHEREPYPGSSEALRETQKRGIKVHFITHNWDSKAMEPHLGPWLKEHFGPNVALSVSIEDKLDILRRIGAFGMVDDRPETIRRVVDAGLWAGTMLQPWNRKLVVEREDVHGFTSWHEFLGLLPSLPGGANGD